MNHIHTYALINILSYVNIVSWQCIISIERSWINLKIQHLKLYYIPSEKNILKNMMQQILFVGSRKYKSFEKVFVIVIVSIISIMTSITYIRCICTCMGASHLNAIERKRFLFKSMRSRSHTDRNRINSIITSYNWGCQHKCIRMYPNTSTCQKWILMPDMHS